MCRVGMGIIINDRRDDEYRYTKPGMKGTVKEIYDDDDYFQDDEVLVYFPCLHTEYRVHCEFIDMFNRVCLN